MKIVLPVHHFPPRYSAGAEQYTLRLARQLIRRGDQAEVVCVERVDWAGPAPLLAEHDVYQGVPVWRLSLDLGQAPDRLRWSYDNPLIGQWFAGYLAQARPDLVHLQSGYLLSASVLAAARQMGVPAVLTLHDFWFLCPRITLLRGDATLCHAPPSDPAECAWCMRLDSRRYRLPEQLSGGLLGQAALALGQAAPRAAIAERRAYLRDALGWPDTLIAPSRFLAEMFAGQVAPERLEVLRYGLDSELLREIPARADDGVLRLGYLGQIAPHKGVHLLVQAIRMLPAQGRPVDVAIYGDLEQHPGYAHRLRRQAGGDKRIRLAGRFDHAAIGAVLAGVDVTVAPSVWYENSPLAIMEAHAAGRPVLTSALGGMAELVHHGVDGLLFRADDAADLARQIQRLREEPGLLAKLRRGITALPTAAEELGALVRIYERAIARHAAVGAEVA